MVKTLPSNAGGVGSIPGWRNKVPHAVGCCQTSFFLSGNSDGLYFLRLLDDISDSMDMSLSKLWAIVKDREAWNAAFHGVGKSRAQQQKRERECNLFRQGSHPTGIKTGQAGVTLLSYRNLCTPSASYGTAPAGPALSSRDVSGTS